MAFYLRPTTGHVSLQKLHTFAVNRLEFLLKIHQAGGDRLRLVDIANNLQTVADSDCLIEGTQKDNISHFILRLLFVADQETTDFFLQAETQLFQFRFSCLTEKEIYRLLKSTTKHVQTTEKPCAATYNEADIHHVVSILQAIKQSAGTWQNAANQYMTGRNGQYFQVPFQAVNSLVTNRNVVLHRGMAMVHYDNLDEVLTGVFRSVLQLTLKQASKARRAALQDVRMKRCAKMLKSIYRAKVPISLNWNNLSCLSHDQVDQSEYMFPLCMSSLHKALRTNHRLKHNDRVQYSLFLKEVGMPVHQAIKLWKQEYSQPSHVPGTGLHSWQADECRYTYSIRHLYGLEGARRNYRGHCCASLQRRQLGPAEQGGCPLVHFDNHHLGNLLTNAGILEADQAVILHLKSSDDPCGACAVYLRHRAKAYLDQQGIAGRRDRQMQGCQPPAHQTLYRHREYHVGDCGHMQKTSGNESVYRIKVPGQDGAMCDDSEVEGQDGAMCDDSEVEGQDGAMCDDSEVEGQDGAMCDDSEVEGQDGVVCDDSEVEGQDGAMCDDSEVEGQDGVVCDHIETDGEVILVSVHTKHRGAKRSLSIRSERVKKQVLWYERGKLAVQDDRAVMETNVVCVTSSDDVAKSVTDGAQSGSDRWVLCQKKLSREEQVKNLRQTTPSETSFHNSLVTISTTPTTSRPSVPLEHEHGFEHKLLQDHVCSADTPVTVAGDIMNCGSCALSAANPPVPPITVAGVDTMSCFQHDVCPSQTESNTQLGRLDRARVRLQHLSDFHIHKPVDFYTCFKELVEGLKSRVKECQ